MNDLESIGIPSVIRLIEADLEKTGFTMSSNILTGSILRTLAASKRRGSFLELGTGGGMSTAWLLEGMDSASTLITVENDVEVHKIAKRYLGSDRRVKFYLGDGGQFIQQNPNNRFDFVFADTWPGKFYLIDEILHMLNVGGIYVIDDLLPVASWPEEHLKKVQDLIDYMGNRDDLVITKLAWSTGLIIATRSS